MKKYILFLFLLTTLAAQASLPPGQDPALGTGAPPPVAARVARRMSDTNQNNACLICTNNYGGQDCLRIHFDCSSDHHLCLDCLSGHVDAEIGRIASDISRPRRKTTIACPICRASITCRNAIKKDAQNRFTVMGVQEALRPEVEVKIEHLLTKLSANHALTRNHPDLMFHQLLVPQPQVPIIPAPQNNSRPTQSDSSKQFQHFMRTYVSEASIGFFLGLLLSVELKKPITQKEMSNRALHRTLYLPAALCSHAFLHKFNPERRWSGATLSSAAIGLTLGILIPTIAKKNSSAS
jgi:hypothetical protein